MPHFLNDKQKQFKTEQANQSRLCTKIRFVVEAVNGILKKSLEQLMAFYKILN